MAEEPVSLSMQKFAYKPKEMLPPTSWYTQTHWNYRFILILMCKHVNSFLKKQLNIRFSTIMSKDTLGSHYFQALFFSIWRNKENLCKASVRPQSGTDLASEAQLPDVESLNDLDGGKRVKWLSSTYSLTFECHFYHIFFVSRVISYIMICYIISCFLSFHFLRLWWLLCGGHVHNDGRAFQKRCCSSSSPSKYC